MLRAVRISLLLGLFVLITTTLTVSAQQDIIPKAANVLYAGESATSDLLDVYTPDGGTSPYPVVIMYTTSSGSKSDLTDFGAPQSVASMGYAVVTVGYRTSLPEMYSDAFCALAWVYANAQQYHLDTNRIALYGISWGGLTSAIIAGTDDPTSYLTNCPNSLPDRHVLRGVITNSGVFFTSTYEITEFVSDGLLAGVAHLPADTLKQTLDLLQANPADKWSTLQFSDDAKNVLENFPPFHLKGHEPPFLMVQGVSDSTVPYADTLTYAQALLKHGNKVQLVFDPLSGHGVSISVYDQEMAAFLKRIFG